AGSLGPQKAACTVDRGRMVGENIAADIRPGLLPDSLPSAEIRPARLIRHDNKAGGPFHDGVVDRDVTQLRPWTGGETGEAEIRLRPCHRSVYMLQKIRRVALERFDQG